MRCPRCAAPLSCETVDGIHKHKPQTPYRENALPDSIEQISGAIWVDRCAICGGTWFDLNEMHLALEQIDQGKLQLPTPLVFLISGERDELNCPRCSTVMLRLRSEAVRAVTYDKCSRCNGVWFDGGEARQFDDPVSTTLALVLEEFRASR